ncbi:MAG: hypothetical protein WC799_21415 [Desulfobacteraceae bacterium]|jgi:hypothetical protein
MTQVRSLRVFIVLMLAAAFLVNAQSAWAFRVSGTGYGKTPEEARKEALAELAQNIRVEVKSSFISVQTQRNKNLDEMKSKAIQLKSELPVLGAQFSELSAKEGFMVDAVLTSSSAGLYEKELQSTAEHISKNLEILNKTTANDSRSNLLRRILAQIEQYYSLRIVAQFLKCEKIPDIPVTAEDISGRLSDIEKKADSLGFGAKVLARSFTNGKIFIYPPTPLNSSEVTPFSSAVKDHLSKSLKTVSQPDKAECFLTGSYMVLKDGLELTCHLTDKNHTVLSSNVVFFLPDAYKSYPVEPVSMDFEKLVNEGHVISGDFKVDIKTTQGKSDLLYKKGDTLKILVKMNKPGYFYLVSHNFKKDKYSYIINFTEEMGNRKFVYYVDGDSANRWIELGDFEVVAPFGVETLQMVAATEDLVSNVPPTFFDKETGLYTISDSNVKKGKPLASRPEAALSATRGLIMKKKSATSEAVIVFTSMDDKTI